MNINPNENYRIGIDSHKPSWSFKKAEFDVNYSNYTKSNDPLRLTTDARQQLMKYQNHSLMIYTDGSVLETGHTGFGFTIPDLKITKSYYIGYGYSVFMHSRALNHLDGIV